MNKCSNNFVQTSNLIDTTRDNANSNNYECLVSSERNNINNLNSKKTKKVKFSDKVEYIDVECWKKYNIELTADENFDDINGDEMLKDNNEKKANNNNDKEKNKKKDNIACTCILI